MGNAGFISSTVVHCFRQRLPPEPVGDTIQCFRPTSIGAAGTRIGFCGFTNFTIVVIGATSVYRYGLLRTLYILSQDLKPISRDRLERIMGTGAAGQGPI